jgi:hypothetical protein
LEANKEYLIFLPRTTLANSQAELASLFRPASPAGLPRDLHHPKRIERHGYKTPRSLWETPYRLRKTGQNLDEKLPKKAYALEVIDNARLLMPRNFVYSYS